LIAAGLKPGDSLIVEGMMRVQPGGTVKAVPWEGPKTGQEAPTAKPSPAKSN
jgi:membrane fusion protein (multidrug efflux system)